MFFLVGLVCLFVLPGFACLGAYLSISFMCITRPALFGFTLVDVVYLRHFMGSFRADLILENNLSAELENRRLTVEGVIDSLPVQLKGGQHFIFRAKVLSMDAVLNMHTHKRYS